MCRYSSHISRSQLTNVLGLSSVLSAVAKFDKFPMDLSWTLESVTDAVIMMQRPRGWYNKRFEMMSVLEKIPVFGSRPDTEYRFTIRDTYMCDDDPTVTCGVSSSNAFSQPQTFRTCVIASLTQLTRPVGRYLLQLRRR